MLSYIILPMILSELNSSVVQGSSLGLCCESRLGKIWAFPYGNLEIVNAESIRVPSGLPGGIVRLDPRGTLKILYTGCTRVPPGYPGGIADS